MLVFLIRSSRGGDDYRRRVDVFLFPKTLGRYLAVFIYFFLKTHLLRSSGISEKTFSSVTTAYTVLQQYYWVGNDAVWNCKTKEKFL